MEEFGRRLSADAPPLAVVEDVRTSELPTRGGTGFTIERSSTSDRARTLVSPDIATCRDCLEELVDPSDRRYRHPFITCTHCGPRFTIVTGLPYDRAATTMADFEMCGACRAEYEDPRDRRFHAQPIACPDCGPRLELVGWEGVSLSRDEDALRTARKLLAEGGIIAVKGLGGYHLVCDARDDAAVAELRRRKRRGGKPFAVMVPDLDAARRLVTVTADEEELLSGGRRPIVLLPRHPAGPGAGVSDAVAPGSPHLGLLLPYTPLHVLLFGIGDDDPGPDALVMTSANLSGEPIVTDDGDALAVLAPLVDAWLRHDRRIHVPCDDSVSRWAAGAELPLRRSRGYAPLPLALPFDVPPTLAVGADLKNTCALAEGRYAWLSQHIGDMDDLSTVCALTRTEKHLEDLTGVAPTRLVADRHPGYHSGDWARAHAAGRPVRTVQHHHAHIASVMAEHGLGADERVIGIAFDGTGHGADGAAWGGEVLVAATRRSAGPRTWVTYRWPGATRVCCGRTGWPSRICTRPASPGTTTCQRYVPARPPNATYWPISSPPDSAACPRRAWDGSSTRWRPWPASGTWWRTRRRRPWNWRGWPVPRPPGPRHRRAATASASVPGREEPAVADPGPVVRAVVSDVRDGVPAGLIAMRFHTAVAALATRLADLCHSHTGLSTVALGGGVFQNAVLLEAVQLGLNERGFTVLRPRLLPERRRDRPRPAHDRRIGLTLPHDRTAALQEGSTEKRDHVSGCSGACPQYRRSRRHRDGRSRFRWGAQGGVPPVHPRCDRR